MRPARPLRRLAAALVLTAAASAGPARAQTAGTPPVAAPAVTPVAWSIDPSASSVTYDMHHPTHAWTGTSRALSGTLLVGTGGAVVGGTVAVPVASFDSGNRNRDSNMIEVTDAIRYRAVTFQAVRVTALATPSAEATATIDGVLTFHGVRRAVRVPVRIETAAGRVHLRGTFAVGLSEYGVTPPSLLGIRTDDRLGLTLDLVARPS